MFCGHPVRGGGSDNDNSVVLQIKFRERTILLTGDIEKAAERLLLATKPESRRRESAASRQQNIFDRWVRAGDEAQFAIICVGRNSMFGHPHEEVVHRWQSNGATVLTTGEHGTITVSTDGHHLSLKKFIE